MRLVVARVGRAHGIRGEVTVEVRTDSPQRRFVVGADLYPVPPGGSGGTGVPGHLTLSAVRDHNDRLLLAFAEVADRDAAEALRGVLLEAEVPDTPEEPDAWYDHQLIGLTVYDPVGRRLGAVVGVEHPPAQDLLVVRPDAGGPPRLVPLVGALVPEVDVPGGRLVVDDPGGLLGEVPDDVPGEAPEGAAPEP